MHRLNEGALPLSTDYQALLDENVDCPAYCHSTDSMVLAEPGFRRQLVARSQSPRRNLLLHNSHQLSIAWFV